MEVSESATRLGAGFGFSGEDLGVLYGMARPGVRRVMLMAKVDCWGIFVAESFGIVGGGTGMYAVMRRCLFCFCIEYSEMGPSGVWIEMATP